MIQDQLHGSLVFVSGTLRIVAVLSAAIAMHDLVRNGLHVRKVAGSAKLLLYVVLVLLLMSASAAAFRLYGMAWAPVFREVSHAGVSVGIIVVSYLVLRARSCAGVWINCTTGSVQHETETGPGRPRVPDDTDWESVQPLRHKQTARA